MASSSSERYAAEQAAAQQPPATAYGATQVAPAGDGAAVAAPAMPRLRDLWILGPWWDLLLFVATPLLIIPLVFLAQSRWGAQEIYLFVASFGAVGHHLPGMIRAYGDRDLFERFRLRFIVAPLFLLAVCLLFTLHDLSGILLVVYAWGVWHGLMQTYGFLRIYDSKAKSFAPMTARLDRWMCFAWFGGAVVLSPTRSHNLLATFYEAGGPIVPPAAVAAAKTVALWGLAAVTAVYFVHLASQWRRGTPPSPVKLLLMVTSFGFWWYANVMVASLLVGIALFEIFHDVQYLSIVWIYNQKRASDARGRLSRFARFLFRRSGALVGVYVGLVFAYGSLNYVAQGVAFESLKQALMGVLLASTLLHFYYDGFIWKVREKSTRAALGLEGGAGNKTPGWVVHSLRWSIFVLPLLWLGLAEARSLAAPEKERVRALAEALPELGQAQYDYAVDLAADGRVDEAIARYRRALELDPGMVDAHYNLANALVETGHDEEAIAHYRQALELDPEALDARANLANALLRRGEVEPAIGELRRVVRERPEAAEAHGNLANALSAAGRFEEAERHARRAVELEPASAQAQYNLGVLLARRGDVDGAIARYRRALAAEPDFAEAHFNLANAHLRQGNGSEAIAHYREALRLAPDAETRFRLGTALAQGGRLAEATDELRAAIAARPGFAEAHHNLGLVLDALGRRDEAIAALREALRLDPAYEDARRNLAALTAD